MEMKKYAILHDVKVEQIPVEWVKKAWVRHGISPRKYAV